MTTFPEVFMLTISELISVSSSRDWLASSHVCRWKTKRERTRLAVARLVWDWLASQSRTQGSSQNVWYLLLSSDNEREFTFWKGRRFKELSKLPFHSGPTGQTSSNPYPRSWRAWGWERVEVSAESALSLVKHPRALSWWERVSSIFLSQGPHNVIISFRKCQHPQTI